jgi:hypothetical protein
MVVSRSAIFASLIANVLSVSIVTAEERWLLPDSPYRLGEAYPDVAATCETVNDWIEFAPQTDDRVSFAITGKLERGP